MFNKKNIFKNKTALRILAVILFLLMVTAAGCRDAEKPDDGSKTSEPESGSVTESETDEVIAPVTIPEEEEEPLTEPDTDETETETEPVSETETETDKAEEAFSQEKLPLAARLTSNYINMLTGLPATEEEYYRRPMAIMINNIKKSLPQVGVGLADIIYECTVEGGLTRLMMVVNDYASCGEIGSIRSSREYYLNFAANHNAIYMHAGGSNAAYDEIQRRRINNLDFVNGRLPASYCYRNEERRTSMGYEHSLMTDGARIVSAIEYKKYDTKISDTFVSAFNFVSYDGGVNPMTGGGDAKHVIITYNSSHFPQFIYSAGSKIYRRYQYNGMPHIDGGTDLQLEFKNVLILNMPHSYTGDSYGHIDVDTVGSGDGYYISEGKYIPIKWSVAANDRPMVLTNADGSLLYMNCGKTFVNIVSDSVFKTLEMDHKNK